MLWTEYIPVIKIGPKGALGSHEIRPIHSAPSSKPRTEYTRKYLRPGLNKNPNFLFFGALAQGSRGSGQYHYVRTYILTHSRPPIYDTFVNLHF